MTAVRNHPAIAVLTGVLALALVVAAIGGISAAQTSIDRQHFVTDADRDYALAMVAATGTADTFTGSAHWTADDLVAAGESVCSSSAPDGQLVDELVASAPGRLGPDGAQIIIRQARAHLC